jgi:hypothetical protein
MSAQMSYAKLSMFEPKMELSDQFRYVIDNMFCCEEDDSDTEEYIKDFIFDYFGITYVTSILLGGIAQSNIFINRDAKERLEQNSVQIQHQAQIAFDLSMGANISGSIGFGTTITDTQVKNNYNSFIKEVQSIYTTTLGGDPSINNLAEWSKTVLNNPVIIKFKVQDIFRLFSKFRFPNDPLITNKSKLIEKTLEKYLANSIYCYNNCGGNGTRGTCVPTGLFQFGICQCKPGWTGVDCENQLIEQTKILHGTICGFDRSFMRVNCGGLRPWEACPVGWAQYNWHTDLTICYKSKTEIGNPAYGTICGLHSYHSTYNFDINIGCNGTSNVLNETCPSDYEQLKELKIVSVNVGRITFKQNAVCAATNVKEHLPGTLCGMQIEGTIDGPTCDGYNPGLRQCPPGYTSMRTAFNDFGFKVCVKN